MLSTRALEMSFVSLQVEASTNHLVFVVISAPMTWATSSCDLVALNDFFSEEKESTRRIEPLPGLRKEHPEGLIVQVTHHVSARKPRFSPSFGDRLLDSRFDASSA